MRKNLSLLENRISKTVSRVKQLGEDRAALQAEVRTLRDKLEAKDNQSATETDSVAENPAVRAELISTLRQAVLELRAD
jgi:hypothetical protein